MSRGIVTRTVRTLKIDGLFADNLENKLIQRTIYLPYKKIDSKNQAEKHVRKYYSDSRYTFVSIIEWSTSKTLYGCTEEHFMQFAQLYDEKTRKPIEEKEN